MKNLIFITGKAASGKTTIAKKLEKKGYFMVSMDKIIKDKIVPKFQKEIDTEFNGEIRRIFRLYRFGNQGNTIELARKLFIKIIKDLIKKHKKVVVLWSLSNHNTIREIFGGDDNFTLYFIKPKNQTTYINRLQH